MTIYNNIYNIFQYFDDSVCIEYIEIVANCIELNVKGTFLNNNVQCMFMLKSFYQSFTNKIYKNIKST